MKRNLKMLWMIVTIIMLILLVVGFFFIKTDYSEPEADKQNVIIPEQFDQQEVEAEADTIEAAAKEKESTYKKGLYSWGPNTIAAEKSLELFEVVERLDINEVYQYYDDISADHIEAMTFAKELDERDIDLYILAGSSEWTYKPDAYRMLSEIERAVGFRQQWGKDALAGIVFDIEPYTSKKWEKGKADILMDNFVAGMKIAYEKAKQEDLRIILCIPFWYDVDYIEALEQLIQYSDEVSVMNYDRNNEYENIKNEVDFAKTYEKSITCIFEFQAVGQYGLTETQTYDNVGLETAKENFESIYKRFEYSDMKFAYHYLEPLKEFIVEFD